MAICSKYPSEEAKQFCKQKMIEILAEFSDMQRDMSNNNLSYSKTAK